MYHFKGGLDPPCTSPNSSLDKGGTSCINARKGEEGTIHSDHAKRNLRGLEGKGDISLVSGEEKDLLPDPQFKITVAVSTV